MKKNFYFLLMAALVCGLSLSVTSCKDDDKDNGPSEEELEQQALEQQDLDNARIAILDQLADLDEVESSEVDLLSQEFKPVIGVPDENEEAIRYVYTNTMEAAAERFADLVGAEIDENTPS